MKYFRIKHEHILCYAKNINLLEILGTEITNLERYKEEDEYVESRGKFYLQKLGMGSIQYSSSLDYPIDTPDGKTVLPKDNNSGKKACWRWSKSKFDWGREKGFVVIKKDSSNIWTVYTKQYLNCDNEGNLIKRTQRPLGVIDSFSSTQASKYLDSIGLGNYFNYSKPYELIKYLIERIDMQRDYVLDFFAGSGTTAQAVFQANIDDNGQRKFICVQLPEVIESNPDENDLKFKFISDLTKERIRRTGEGLSSLIKKDLFIDGSINIDFGFKSFKLDTSNINSWDGSLENFELNLLNTETNIKIDRTEEDVLFEVLLKYGLNLTVPIEEKIINNCKVYSVGLGTMFVCLSDNITTEVAEELGKWKEQLNPTSCRVLFKDNGFKDDVAKTNSIQILKRFAIQEINSI